MPHLSPMNWISTFLLFWLLLILISTSTWWQQLPKFPPISSSSTYTFRPWSWAM